MSFKSLDLLLALGGLLLRLLELRHLGKTCGDVCYSLGRGFQNFQPFPLVFLLLQRPRGILLVRRLFGCFLLLLLSLLRGLATAHGVTVRADSIHGRLTRDWGVLGHDRVPLSVLDRLDGPSEEVRYLHSVGHFSRRPHAPPL